MGLSGMEEGRKQGMKATGAWGTGARRTQRLRAPRGRGWGLRLLAGLVAALVAGASLPAAGGPAGAAEPARPASASPVAGGKPVQVVAAEGLVPAPGGGWELQGRVGRLRLRLPAGTGALSVTLPEGGPVLLTPPGYRVRVVAATPSGLVHEIVPPEGAGSEAELEFHAVPEQTVQPSIGAVTALPGEGGFRILAEGGDGGTPGGDGGGTEPPGPALATVRIFGGGNGHRTGLSQYGAQGLARLGVGYRDILQHYYPGTQIQTLKGGDTGQSVRVGLSMDPSGKGNSAPFPRSEWIMELPPGARVQAGSTRVDLTGTYKLTFKYGKGFRFEPQPGTPGEPVDLNRTKLDVVAPDGGEIILYYPKVTCDPKDAYKGCRRYEGRLEFEGLQGDQIVARNWVNLRQYLMGVVPHEMPASWGTEALKAQTVAARTYAARQNFGLDQNLVDSTYDQVYYGRYEDGTPDGRYEKKMDGIVKATDGQLLYYKDQLAGTYFSSSNGGWIASNTEGFGNGTGTPLPYLTGREDRYRLKDGTTVTPESYWRGKEKYESPWFRWEREFAPSVIEQKWPQVGRLQSIEVVSRSKTWFPLQIRITGSAGSVVVSGNELRSKLGLPSAMVLPDKLYPRQFYDVKEGALAAEINRAYQLGLVSGDIYARFQPGGSLTRSAFAKMLVGALEAATGRQLPGPDNDPDTPDEPFSDVTPGQALYVYVVKAYKAGLVEGYPDGTFGYDRSITREEAAAMIQRALGLPEAGESFADVPDDARFAGAIGAVAAAGIMKGYSEKEFRPKATMKRGEAAAVALRSYDHCRLKGCTR